MSTTFPFTAVVGQSQMKLALLLCMVDPKIGGVLLSGGRGSAKSTLVRSAANLSSGMELTTIPLGASEEMITGSIKLESALGKGEVEFNPGLLARAHGGLLYVDEVNLLPDHLVDLLLDVAASNVNLIERDGISHSHPSEFVLIGTMNPDEGELRPQLLDRFGLMAAVESHFTQVERREIVEQRLQFDRDPESLLTDHADAMRDLTAKLTSAINRLASVIMPDTMSTLIAELCENAGVEGLRADITLYRAALAHAALSGNARVSEFDIHAVSELVLAHRRQQKSPPPDDAAAGGNQSGTDPDNQQSPPDSQGGSSIQGSWGAMAPQAVDSSAPLTIGVDNHGHTNNQNQHRSRQTNERTAGDHRGLRTISAKSLFGKPDWFRTLVACENRHRESGCDLVLQRRKPLKRSIQLDIILLDTSASTLAGGGLSTAKGVIRALSLDAYLARRKLAIVTFGNQTVSTILHPQRAPKNVEPLLQTIHGGGGTPLNRGLDTIYTLIKRMENDRIACNLFVLTDGRTQSATAVPQRLQTHCRITVVDIESASIKLGMSRRLAGQLGAQYVAASSPDHHFASDVRYDY